MPDPDETRDADSPTASHAPDASARTATHLDPGDATRDPDPAPSLRAAVDSIVLRFDQAWRDGPVPDLVAFLPPDGHVREAAARQLIAIDEERRRAAGLPLRTNEYRDALGGVTVDETVRTVTPAPLPAVPGYELLEHIGSGGMGDVYRARELAFDRDVAVKVLQSRYPANSSAARRFLDEARITAQLQHPGIPPVHHVGALADGRPFLAMKLIKGDTLADLLATGHEQPATTRGRFVAAFAQVCQAVAYAHARKVIHRDLKPGNVMVGAFGEVQVMDWGLAKVLGGEAEASREGERSEAADDTTEIRTLRDAAEATQAGSILGTPAFMAPEQAGGEIDKIDERSDVFGLGAMLCAVLTGQPPYAGSNTDSIRLMAIRGDTASALARLDACAADPELVALCKRCLARERDDRPRDAGEVAKAVAEYLAAAEERARQAELDRVRAEGERALAEARAAEEEKTRREAEGRVAAERQKAEAEERVRQEERRRRRTQFALAGAVVLLLTVVALGGTVAWLWQSAESARGEAEAARDAEGAARLDAERQREFTQLAREREAEARRQLDRERDKSDVLEYAQTIEAARQALQGNSPFAARALLNSVRPVKREWEWEYVNRVRDDSLLTLRVSEGGVQSAEWSPDGARLLTADNRVAKVWDARSGRLLRTLAGHADTVWKAAWSPNGERVATASQDGTTRVWDAGTGAEQFVLPHGGHSVSFSPDGTRLLTDLGVFDARTGKEDARDEWREGRPRVGVWSRDGSRVAGVSDQAVRVWDAKTGAEVVSIRAYTGPRVGWVLSVAFSPDGSRLATTSHDPPAKVWDVKTGAEVLTLRGHTDWVTSASFNPDGTRIVTGSYDRTAKVWNAATGAELLTLRGHTGFVNAASFSPDGTRVLTASADGTVKMWDARIGEATLTLAGHVRSLRTAGWSPDGGRVLTGGGDRAVKMWDAATGTELLTLRGHTGWPTSAVFSPDGGRVLTGGGGDRTARVWDAKTGAAVLTLEGHAGGVRFVGWAPDSTRVVTASDDRTARVWDAKTGALLLTLEGHAGGVRSVAFSPDGTRVVTAGGDGSARVWDAKTGAGVLTLGGHVGAVTCAAWSRDGSRLVTAGDDGTARVWDVKTRFEVLILRGHEGAVLSAGWSQNGARVITAGRDGTARLWDTGTGAPVLTMREHAAGVTCAGFSPDGTRVLTGSADGTVRLRHSRPPGWSGSLALPPELAPPPRVVGK